MPKYSRKDKIVLEDVSNSQNVATISISIEGNHLDNSFDILLADFNNKVKSILSKYKEKVPEKKQPKISKNKGFGNSGGFV